MAPACQEGDRHRQFREDGGVRADLARKHGIANLEYRLGDLEDVPIRSGTVDLAFLSQALHHARASGAGVAEAWRILKPGGRIAILDLGRHNFEKAREMYADLWLGFTELEIERYLKTRASRTWRRPWYTASRRRRTSRRCSGGGEVGSRGGGH